MSGHTIQRSVVVAVLVATAIALGADAQQLSDQQSGQTPTSRPAIVPRGPHSWPEMPLEQRIQRARQLVAAFTQRPIAEELQFVGEWLASGLCPVCAFELPATGEKFEVEECDEGSMRWDFGRTMPDVGVSPADTEAFEKAFCARFFPEVPSERLVQYGQHRWGELLPNDVIFAAQRCCFVPGPGNGRYQCCAKRIAELRTDPAPRIDAEEAKRRAVAYIAGWPGIRSAELSDRGPKAPDPRAVGAASLEVDDLGMQRLCYDCRVRIQPTDSSQYEGYSPYGIFVLVDAVTGVCTVCTLVSPWAVNPKDVRPTCTLSNPQRKSSWLYLLYEPRLIDRRVYFCGQYLDSYLWGGSYAFDRESGSFTAVFRDHTWQGKVGERQLLVDGVAETYPAAPLRIEEEAYLPAEMLERITGWQVRHTPLGINQAGNVELVHPAVAAAEREEKRP
jgi:hypothetical protein